MPHQMDLGGVSPMGARARLRWRSRLRSPTANPVYKISGGGLGGARPAPDFFQSGASTSGGLVGPSGGGGGGGAGFGGGFGGGFHRRGWWPYYGGYYWPYWSYPYSYAYYPSLYPIYPSYYTYPYTYPSYQTYTETVPSACCYDEETGTLYCPGSQYDGAPAYAEATRLYQGRPMSRVSSPRLSQEQWFWNCPTEGQPSANAPRLTRLRARAA